MALITVQELNDWMSNPEWTPGQRRTAGVILDGVERGLEKALYNSYITPRVLSEVAPILDSGLVGTRQPVSAVQEINGVTVDETHPLAFPWVIVDYRLRHADPVTFVPNTAPYTAWGVAAVPHYRARGQVQVTYRGGWGEEPALVLAMLRKAQTLMGNRFDDSVLARAMDAQQPIPLGAEDWTEDELRPLGTYRNLGGWR